MRVVRVIIFIGAFVGVMTTGIHAASYDLVYELGTSARHIAIGNIEGFSNSADSVFENPAGLYRVNQIAIAAFATKVMGEVQYTNLAISGGDIGVGRVGIGVMESRVADIPSTNMSEILGNSYPIVASMFDYKSSVYKLAYQIDGTERLKWGINYVYYQKSFHRYKGNGSNIDFGAIYTQDKSEISALIRNAIPNKHVVYSNGAKEKLETQYILSTKRAFNIGVDIYGQAKLFHGQLLPSVGALYRPNFMPFIQFMGGYKTFLDAVQNKHNNMTIGIGLDLMGVTIYYAYERSDYVLKDHKSYLSLTTMF